MSRRVSVKGPDLATNSHDVGATAAAATARPDPFPAEQAAWDTIFARRQREELAEARRKHPDPVLSLHEGYAILAEEVDELWDLVRQRTQHRSGAAVLEELVQVAAMAQRIAEDLGYTYQAAPTPSLYQVAQRRAMTIDGHVRRTDELERELSVVHADLRQAQAALAIQQTNGPTVRRARRVAAKPRKVEGASRKVSEGLRKVGTAQKGVRR